MLPILNPEGRKVGQRQAGPTSRLTAALSRSHRHRDSLQLCIVGEAGFTEFSTDAAHLEATKWGRGVKDVVAIDPHRAGSQIMSHLVRLLNIASPDGSGQSVTGVVCSTSDLGDVLELQDTEDRSEDLFASNIHLVMDVGKNCRLNEVTTIAVASTTGLAVRSLRLTAIDVAHDLVELSLVDLWPLLSFGVKRIPKHALARAFDELCDELIMD